MTANFMLSCLWVPISSTGKVSCRRARDLGSNPAYTKNQLVSWPNGKSNHHGADAIGSNSIVTIKKKCHVVWCCFDFGWL
jgi:hypothetical protein